MSSTHVWTTKLATARQLHLPTEDYCTHGRLPHASPHGGTHRDGLFRVKPAEEVRRRHAVVMHRRRAGRRVGIGVRVDPDHSEIGVHGREGGDGACEGGAVKRRERRGRGGRRRLIATYQSHVAHLPAAIEWSPPTVRTNERLSAALATLS